MLPDVITGPSFGPFADLLSSTVEALIEVVLATNSVLIEKESFAELSAYLDRIAPLLKEFYRKNINDSKCLESVVEILNRQTLDAKQLIEECSKKNKFYLLVNCRSIRKRIENITREISRALSCIPLASLDISSGIKEDIVQLIDSMRTAEFRAAISEEEILEKIESGIQQRNVDRSYANNLLVSVAQAIGVSTESSALRREFEEFKIEIDNARLRKDQAEAFQMDQIIALLGRADAATSREEKEKKYFTKRKSLGSQPLEPLLSFYCPITGEVMTDPVETPSGHTFERNAIEKWLAEGNLCPMTSTPLNNTMLRPNKTLRQSIEEWKDRNTMITISSLKLKLSSADEEEILSCLEQLRDLCEQRETHREWVIMEEYIPILIKLLGSKSKDIRNSVLEVLFVLAKDGNDAKERIAEVDNALESIVRSLGRRIAERKSAVALLLEMSNCKSVQESIGKVQGCILLLVTMSRSCDDNKAAKDARDILDNISFLDDNVIRMAKANYFKYLLQRLSSGSSDVKLRMAKTLGEMELTDHIKSSLFEEGVLHSLLSLLSHGEIEVKQAAVKALLNLSSLPKNGQEMIRQGVIRPLLDTLYRYTSSENLRELVAATITNLAFSSANSETHISLLDTDEEIYQLFSLVTFTGPAVQQSILRAFSAMCKSPSATSVKAKLAQGSAVQVLVQFCEHGNSSVRSDAVKLFCCLTENGDEAMIQEHVEQKFIEALLNIIKNSQDEEEIASTMGIISNIPKSPQVSEWLFAAEGLQIFSSFLPEKNKNSCKPQLVENAVGALCHFTVSINQHIQQIAALVPKLVRLLDLGTSLTKKRAAISLAQLSENSQTLSRPVSKRQGLWCFSPSHVEICPVHRGICTLESSFCLVEAGAVGPLVRVLGDPDPGVCEASLDALLTLIKDEKLQSGVKVLAEENTIPSMVKLLDSPSPRLQQKVLNSLERIFRLQEYKLKYGTSVHMPLVDLTQRGTSNIKSLAAKVLAQLNVLHDQSSYF